MENIQAKTGFDMLKVMLEGEYSDNKHLNKRQISLYSSIFASLYLVELLGINSLLLEDYKTYAKEHENDIF